MNPHEVLGVSKNASGREIRRAYCVLALKYHPDKNPAGTEKFREATDAYRMLTDPDFKGSGPSGPVGPPPPVHVPSEPVSPWPRRAPESQERPWWERRDGRPFDEPPGPPAPWPKTDRAYEPPTPRANWGSPAPAPVPWSAYASYPGYSNYAWVREDSTVLGRMIEELFYEEFGVRWADLPYEAQQALLRGRGT